MWSHSDLLLYLLLFNHCQQYIYLSLISIFKKLEQSLMDLFLQTMVIYALICKKHQPLSN